MDVKNEVDETAGKVWHLLDHDGPQTLTQLKKQATVASELLHFAIGWLAREDKVDIVQEKKSFRVQLK